MSQGGGVNYNLQAPKLLYVLHYLIITRNECVKCATKIWGFKDSFIYNFFRTQSTISYDNLVYVLFFRATRNDDNNRQIDHCDGLPFYCYLYIAVLDILSP